MDTYSPTRRTMIGLAGLILVIETGLSTGHLVLGVHPMEGIWLAVAVFACASWWIYQCALIVVTGRSNPALDMPLFGDRAPDVVPVLIVGDGRASGAGRVIGSIRPEPMEIAHRPSPRRGPNGGRRKTPARSRKAS